MKRCPVLNPMNDMQPRGVILIVVLVVIALLSLAAFTFSEWMLVEREAVQLMCRRVQARALAESGVEKVRILLAWEPEDLTEAGGLFNNEGPFRGVLVLDDVEPADRGRFAVVAAAIEEGQIAGIRFGLEDESTRLNLNTLLLADQRSENGGRTLLLGLPGMTEEIADAILDWIDEDDEIREFGAEADYYTSLDPSYVPKNGPLETVEELLLVRGVTPWLLFGTDANRNHYRDAGEPDMPTVDGVEETEDTSQGWVSYLTMHSMELNLQPDGSKKIELNQDDMEQLYKELETAFGSHWASFIVAYRQNGPDSGSEPGEKEPSGDIDLTQPGRFKLETVIDLVGPRTKVKYKGSTKTATLETPFPDIPGAMNLFLPILMDTLTATSSPMIPGRININQASRVVLEGIPGMTPAVVDEIISVRQQDPIEAEPHRRHETWLMSEGIVTSVEMKAMMPFVCAGGDVYRAQLIGYFDGGGPSSRVEVVFDATTRPARVVSWREISHLGRGYPLETLGVEVESW